MIFLINKKTKKKKSIIIIIYLLHFCFFGAGGHITIFAPNTCFHIFSLAIIGKLCVTCKHASNSSLEYNVICTFPGHTPLIKPTTV